MLQGMGTSHPIPRGSYKLDEFLEAHLTISIMLNNCPNSKVNRSRTASLTSPAEEAEHCDWIV